MGLSPHGYQSHPLRNYTAHPCQRLPQSLCRHSCPMCSRGLLLSSLTRVNAPSSPGAGCTPSQGRQSEHRLGQGVLDGLVSNFGSTPHLGELLGLSELPSMHSPSPNCRGVLLRELKLGSQQASPLVTAAPSSSTCGQAQAPPAGAGCPPCTLHFLSRSFILQLDSLPRTAFSPIAHCSKASLCFRPSNTSSSHKQPVLSAP